MGKTDYLRMAGLLAWARAAKAGVGARSRCYKAGSRQAATRRSRRTARALWGEASGPVRARRIALWRRARGPAGSYVSHGFAFVSVPHRPLGRRQDLAFASVVPLAAAHAGARHAV